MDATREARSPIPALTGLRFVAAFSVLLGHGVAWLVSFPTTIDWPNYFTQGPGLGMPLFFVLSGFVIHYNYGHYFRLSYVDAAARFMIARIARLYPLYLVLLLYFLWKNPDAVHAPLRIWVKFLSLTQAWFLVYDGHLWDGHRWFAVAWSISVEMCLYISYLLWGKWLLGLVRPVHCILAFALVWIAYYALIDAAWTHYEFLRIWGNETFAINADPQNALLGWVFNTGPIGRFFEFCMGAIAAQLYVCSRHGAVDPREQRFGRILLSIGLVASAAIYVGARQDSLLAFGTFYAGMMAPFLAIVTFCCARYRSRFSGWMSSRVAVTLGDASYSIYLLHAFTLPKFAVHPSFLPDLLQSLVGLVVAMAATILIALITYRLIEVPSRRRVRLALGGFWVRWSPRLGHAARASVAGTQARP